MYEHFERLQPEKRDGIVNAALDEFALRGYDLASTNSLVARAGISKGALFHYFGDKKGLFSYLCNFASDLLRQEYFAPLQDPTGDLILRLQRSVGLRIGLLARYPRLFSFVSGLLAEESKAVRVESAFFREDYSMLQRQILLGGLNDGLIRADIPAWEGNRMLWWILEGYSNELTEQLSAADLNTAEIEQEIRHFEEFLPILRRVFYREGQ